MGQTSLAVVLEAVPFFQLVVEEKVFFFSDDNEFPARSSYLRVELHGAEHFRDAVFQHDHSRFYEKKVLGALKFVEVLFQHPLELKVFVERRRCSFVKEDDVLVGGNKQGFFVGQVRGRNGPFWFELVDESVLDAVIVKRPRWFPIDNNDDFKPLVFGDVIVLATHLE